MLKLTRKIIEKLESAPITFRSWLISYTAIIAVRILVEEWIDGLKNSVLANFFYGISHTFLFFLLSYLLVAFLLRYFLKVELKKIFNVILFGYFIIITPPIVDHIVSFGRGFWSFYKFDSLVGLWGRYLTFFGDRWDLGITYGVRFEIAASLVLIFIYSLVKTSDKNFALEVIKIKLENSKPQRVIFSILYSFFIAFLAYTLFFILGTLPSYFTIFTLGFSKGFLAVKDIDIAQMFLSPVKIFSREIGEIKSALSIKMDLIYSLLLFGVSITYFYQEYKEKFLAIVRNSRLPQIIYHLGLLFIGIGIFIAFKGALPEITLFNLSALALLMLSVAGSWITSVIINDIEDEAIDKITNSGRPFVQKVFSLEEYRKIGYGIFLVSFLFAAFVNLKIAILLAAYQAIAYIYSARPLRLKRFPLIASFLSALASLLILLSGYILVSPDQSPAGIPGKIIFLFLLAFTFALPVKDFKDTEGDRMDGVFTIPVISGEQWGKIIIGGGIFFSYLLSIAILHEPRLFWWAVLCGGASFWIIYIMNEGKRVHPHTNLDEFSQKKQAFSNYKKQSVLENILKIGVRVNPRNIFWWILGLAIIYLAILAKIIFS